MPQVPTKPKLSQKVDEGLGTMNIATIVLLILGVIVVIVGGIVVIAGRISFNEYLRQLVILAAAFGLLGIGRGIKAYVQNGKEPPKGKV